MPFQEITTAAATMAQGAVTGLEKVGEILAAEAPAAVQGIGAVVVSFGILSAEDSAHTGLLPAPIANDDKEFSAIKGSSVFTPDGQSHIGKGVITGAKVGANLGANPSKLSNDIGSLNPAGFSIPYSPTPAAVVPHPGNDNPPRRLPPPTNTPQIIYSPAAIPAPAGFTTPIAKVHTVESSATDRLYGHLIHSSVSSTAYSVPDYSAAITQYVAQVKTHQTAAAHEFGNWVNGHQADINLADSGLTYTSAAIPTAPGSSTGTQPNTYPETLVPQFGIGGATWEADLAHQRSRAALSPPVINAHTDFKPKPTPLNFNLPAINPPLVAAGIVGAGAIGFAASKVKAFSPSNMMPKMSNNIRKVLGSVDFSKLFAILSFALELHNAALLSTQVVQSCLDILQNIITAMGLKDWEGNPIDISHMIGDTIENLLKAGLGAKNYTTIKEKWKAYSAVYTAASNIVNSFTSIMYATMSVIEITGQYVATIGNALKRSGTVFEDAYGWLSEGISARTGRLKHIDDALNGAVNFASDLDFVSQNALTAKQTLDEFDTQKQELEEALKHATHPTRPDHEPSKQKDTQDEHDTSPANTTALLRQD